jgi:hypothetical protein
MTTKNRILEYVAGESVTVEAVVSSILEGKSRSVQTAARQCARDFVASYAMARATINDSQVRELVETYTIDCLMTFAAEQAYTKAKSLKIKFFRPVGLRVLASWYGLDYGGLKDANPDFEQRYEDIQRGILLAGLFLVLEVSLAD